MTYLTAEVTHIAKKNYALDKNKINLNFLSGSSVHGTIAGDNIRDSHLNDAYDGVYAWASTATTRAITNKI